MLTESWGWNWALRYARRRQAEPELESLPEQVGYAKPVAAIIPRISDAAQMADNLNAMRGRVPDAQQRECMVTYVRNL